MDAELRVRTCRLIEQMRRQPEHACRLGLEDVSVFGGKQAESAAGQGDRITGRPAGCPRQKILSRVRTHNAVTERERRGSARKAAAAKGITPV